MLAPGKGGAAPKATGRNECEKVDKRRNASLSQLLISTLCLTLKVRKVSVLPMIAVIADPSHPSQLQPLT